MSTNTSGGRRTQSSSMSDFDKLPRAMRVALANADHNWSGSQLYRAYKRRHGAVRTSALAVEFIKQQDAAAHREDAAAGLVCPGQR